MRQGRPSQTAAWVSALRGLNRASPSAPPTDPVARDLVPLPYTWALDLADRFPGPWSLVQGIADRASFRHFSHVAMRTLAIDDAVRDAVAGGATELIVLGAGLDSRAWRLPELRDTVVFEVDHPATQSYKRAKIGTRKSFAREVRFVAVDFERDSLEERLIASGVDPGARSVFVWEGVTMYLQPEAVEQTLSAIAHLMSSGSTLLATYGQRHERTASAAVVRWLVRQSGEPFRALYTSPAFASVLARHGFRTIADEGLSEWLRRYRHEEGPGSLERLARAVRD